MKLILIRHGLSEGNILNKKERYFIGQLDCALSQEGRRQASLLKTDPRLLAADAVYASDLLRTRETAACLTDKPVISDARLRERSMGALEGHYESELKKDPRYRRYFEDFTHTHFAHHFQLRAPEGENYTDVCLRLCSFLKELGQKDYQSVVLVTHYCTIRCLMHLLAGLSQEETLNFKVENCVPLEVEFHRDQPLMI